MSAAGVSSSYTEHNGKIIGLKKTTKQLPARYTRPVKVAKHSLVASNSLAGQVFTKKKKIADNYEGRRQESNQRKVWVR